MARLFRNRLWLFVIFAFLLLIGAWSTLIYVAHHNQPEPVPLVR